MHKIAMTNTAIVSAIRKTAKALRIELTRTEESLIVKKIYMNFAKTGKRYIASGAMKNDVRKELEKAKACQDSSTISH